MKALVLAGGRGSRLSDLTHAKNKCMCPFAGRPLIEYSLENACSVGVDEIVIVVSYRAESIINHYGNRFRATPIKYVIQWERKGLVHAIEASREALDGADFMLFLADEVLFDPRHLDMIRTFYQQQAYALCGTVLVEDRALISRTYNVIYSEQDNQIYRLIEKPRKPLNNMMGTGNCVFRGDIFEYIPYTPVNQQRGEKELPDLIQAAIDDGQNVRLFAIGGRYVNVNTADDIERLEHELQQQPASTGALLTS